MTFGCHPKTNLKNLLRLRLPLLLVAGSVGLSACNDGDEAEGRDALVNAAALSTYFVKDFAPYEAVASALRDLDPRYTIQRISGWSFSTRGRKYDSYSLAHAGVEYAHAAGLTGAGQTIAIIDGGFLLSHDELLGKAISSAESLYSDDHGTGVAAIAAGSADFGDMIGVAPGADLQLGMFYTLEGMTDATNQARDLGAIVQNNSWGYPNTEATQDDFDEYFGDEDGEGYIAALEDFAKNGVIVFAASNSESLGAADLMAGLPVLLPELEKSWIAVVNAVPTINGGKITSASRISSGCLDAAPWCITADGYVYSANANNDGSYQEWVGTSFAAPQVSGAIALLAEAFPDLSAQELRARLLASADNSFFDHTNYVNFSSNVKHGFNDEFGHGFLDVKAALLPIGGSYLPSSRGGAISIEEPLIIAGGASGNAISKHLGQTDIIFVDGLGGGFESSASILSAQTSLYVNSQATLAELIAVDLYSDASNPFDLSTAFGTSVAGREMNVDLNDTELALLFPASGSGNSSYGFAVKSALDVPDANISVGFSAMRDGAGFLGIQTRTPDGVNGSVQAAASIDWTVPLAANQELLISGSLGIAVADAHSGDVSFGNAQFSTAGVTYAARDVWGKGDRLALGVSLPQAIIGGSAQFELPVGMTRGVTDFETVEIPLTPDGRQVDLSISYGVPMSRNSELVLGAVHSFNAGNIAGEIGTSASIGWKYRF